jgi:DNA (cytosine-5)-methyltransferase 1
MRHGSLFSGIGGFDLAAQWMGWENVFQVEIDDYCQKVLTKNFPNVERYGDIKEFTGKRGSVDVLSGGFPCQPFSHAGKRKGKGDDRYLWPEYFRIIREIQPAYVVGENVAGLVSMDDGRVLDGILLDLESEGYSTEQFIIPACSVGAWHRRARIWITAYRDSSCPDPHGIGSYRQEKQQQGETEFRDEQIRNPEGLGKDVAHTDNKRIRLSCGRSGEGINSEMAGGRDHKRGIGRNVNLQSGKSPNMEKDVSNPNCQGFQTFREQGRLQEEKRKARSSSERGGMLGREWSESWWKSEPNVGRVVNGISNRVDRIKGLGNAIVPQVAYEIFKAIEAIND